MYVSFTTLITFLDWIKEMPVTPSRIDRSLWSAKFSGSSGAQLITGLRWLGLLDGDRPAQRLEDLARGDDDVRKTELSGLLQDAYGAEFLAELPKMTPGMFDESMRKLGTSDGTHRKAVSFFVNAAKSAGIDMPMAIQKRARIRKLGSGRRQGTGKGQAGTGSGGSVLPNPKNHKQDTNDTTGASKTIELRGGGALTLTASVQFLEMPKEDRDFVFGLIDDLVEYEERKFLAEKATVDPEA